MRILRSIRFWYCVNKRQTKTCNSKGIGVGTLEQKVAAAVKQQLGTPEAAERIIAASMSYRDEIKKSAAPKSSAIDAELKSIEKKISNLVDAISGGMISEAVTAKLSELEDRKAQLTASRRMLQSAEDQVGLTDQQICEAVDKLSTANWESSEGLRTLLSVVLRVNVYADRIEVFTIFGGDGTHKEIESAVKDFINTIGAAPPAPRRNGLRSIQKAQPFGWAFLIPLRHSSFSPQNFAVQTFVGAPPYGRKRGADINFITQTHV